MQTAALPATDADPPILSLHNIRKEFGGVVAIAGVLFVALVGLLILALNT